MIIDPSDVAVEHAIQLLQQNYHNVPLPDTPTDLGTSLQTLLSTLYSADASVLLKPAHEHTQPLWGPPDPYLTAGRSIAPTAKGLLGLGLGTAADPATSSASSDVAAELAPQVQSALSHGWKVLDATRVQPERSLPGFVEPSGFLPHHNPAIPPETPETFAAQVEWAAKFLNAIDKLPYVALSYAMVEFFLLRPNLDAYKEDIEDDPARAVAETIKVTTVRMGVFLVLAVVTVGMFGG